MLVTVEIPVFKDEFLEETINSVKKQTYKNWKLLLLSDGASSKAQEIMRQQEDDKIKIYFQENRGIGATRNKLSSLSDSDLILPLDDDDILYPTALEDMVHCFTEHPEAGIVRARRIFIDEKGDQINEQEWFPFAKRNYYEKMTVDIHNHCQPYMIRRSAYSQTPGWEGFDEFGGAGEDCDIFLKVEEKGDVVLLNKVLYGYRINPNRFSLELGVKGAQKMWCMLADKTIQRRGLPLRRVNDFPPFKYEKISACP